MPDLLLACAATAWVMAAVFVSVSFVNRELVSGDAGRVLAWFFAGALAVAGLLLFLLGVTLLRDERGAGDHYRTPMLLGAAVGGGEAALFLAIAGSGWLVLPPFLLLGALRPVRRLAALLTGGKR